MMMPSLYIPHGGGPCFFMEWTMGPPDTWDSMAAWLRALPDTLPRRPRAILLVSAHWEEAAFTVATASRPGMLFDYYGFPPHTYQLDYPAPGDPALAARVEELLRGAGLPAATDPARGFDHGVFVPLLVAFPDAAIPVVPLSLRRGLDPASHLAAGKALAPLRAEDVLIVGSGMSYHDMRGYNTARALTVSRAFDDWLTAAVEGDPAARLQALAAWEQGDGARASHPREEHLLPLMVAAGAGFDAPGQRIFTDEVMMATVSAYRFG